MRSPDQFARKANLTLKDAGLLTRALTHRSYVNEHQDSVEDNERLEFLGDAALDFLSGAYLYKHFPEMDEGQLTRLAIGSRANGATGGLCAGNRARRKSPLGPW